MADGVGTLAVHLGYRGFLIFLEYKPQRNAFGKKPTFWNIYTAVVLQASLTSDLSLQKLGLHLELCEAACDQKQSQSTISMSYFCNTFP